MSDSKIDLTTAGENWAEVLRALTAVQPEPEETLGIGQTLRSLEEFDFAG